MKIELTNENIEKIIKNNITPNHIIDYLEMQKSAFIRPEEEKALYTTIEVLKSLNDYYEDQNAHA